MGSREVQSVNAATIRAWSRKNSHSLLMKDHLELTSVQYLVYNDLRRQLGNACRRRGAKRYTPSMENDAACATLIREGSRLEVVSCERLRERRPRRGNIGQVEDQKAAEAAQRQAELAQIGQISS